MDAWTHGCIYAWMHGCRDAWMHGCMHRRNIHYRYAAEKLFLFLFVTSLLDTRYSQEGQYVLPTHRAPIHTCKGLVSIIYHIAEPWKYINCKTCLYNFAAEAPASSIQSGLRSKVDEDADCGYLQLMHHQIRSSHKQNNSKKSICTSNKLRYTRVMASAHKYRRGDHGSACNCKASVYTAAADILEASIQSGKEHALCYLTCCGYPRWFHHHTR